MIPTLAIKPQTLHEVFLIITIIIIIFTATLITVLNSRVISIGARELADRCPWPATVLVIIIIIVVVAIYLTVVQKFL